MSYKEKLLNGEDIEKSYEDEKAEALRTNNLQWFALWCLTVTILVGWYIINKG